MLIKKKYLIACITLLVSKFSLAENDGENYYVFDKLLSGMYSCVSKDEDPANTMCGAVKYIHFSGWVRESFGDVPADISETTVYTEISSDLNYTPSTQLESEYRFKACGKAMNLVKSNPSKWDLKIGINSSGALMYCEALNQSLVQQYYAEQE